ncbi:hypothetical protein TMatcc_007294 [Talaromyces marneffei ATCC 18224]
MTRILCVMEVFAAERIYCRMTCCYASPVYLGYAPVTRMPSPAEKPRRGCAPEKLMIRPPYANLRTALRMPTRNQASWSRKNFRLW